MPFITGNVLHEWLARHAPCMTHVGCAGLSPMLPLAASILISPQAVVGSQVGCCLKGHLKKILWELQWLPQTTWSGLRPSFHPHVRLSIVLTSEYHVLEFDASPLSNSWSLGQDALSNYTFLKHFSVHIFAVHWFQAPFACKIMSHVRRKGSPR